MFTVTLTHGMSFIEKARLKSTTIGIYFEVGLEYQVHHHHHHHHHLIPPLLSPTIYIQYYSSHSSHSNILCLTSIWLELKETSWVVAFKKHYLFLQSHHFVIYTYEKITSIWLIVWLLCVLVKQVILSC